ncbi:MAG: hypothetical protein ISR98_01360 [Parcubacteria group bacterium]|nr:hypothetical protein [Parcubacteria group bacterium]
MMLMAVSSVKAQGRLKFVVPQEIKDRYLINIDPEQTLVALPAIPVQDCMITMYIVPFMTKEHARLYDSNDRSKMKEEWVQAEAFMCGCPSHTVSDKLLCFRVRINNEWKVVFHQEHKIKKKKQTPLPPNFS